MAYKPDSIELSAGHTPFVCVIVVCLARSRVSVRCGSAGSCDVLIVVPFCLLPVSCLIQYLCVVRSRDLLCVHTPRCVASIG